MRQRIILLLVVLPALIVVWLGATLAGRYYYGSVARSPSPSVTERIELDGIRNGKIAFDLHDEAAPVLQDPEGGASLHRISGQ